MTKFPFYLNNPAASNLGKFVGLSSPFFLRKAKKLDRVRNCGIYLCVDLHYLFLVSTVHFLTMFLLSLLLSPCLGFGWSPLNYLDQHAEPEETNFTHAILM